MSGERQGNNPPIKNVIDDGAGDNPFTLADRFLKSKKARNTSIYAAAIFSGLVPGAAVASNTAIVEEGNMPSQNDLERVIAGVLTEEVDLSQYKTLEVGYKGEEVVKLKQRMVELGYFKNKSSVNNTFTASTPDYIKKFQEVNGLEPDGIADPEMQALFFSDLAKRADGTLVKPVEKPIEVARKFEAVLAGTEEEKQINQRFADFLAGEGDYSEAALNKGKFFPPLSYDASYVPDLGFYDFKINNSTKRMDCEIQAPLLSHFGYDGSEFVTIGIKDRNGRKRMTILEIPVKAIIDGFSYIAIERESGTHDNPSYALEEIKTEKEYAEFLDGKIGEIVKLNLDVSDYNDPNRLKSLNKVSEGISNYYMETIRPRVDDNLRFVSGVWMPPTDILKRVESWKGFVKTLGNNKLLSVESYEEVMKVLNKDSSSLPLVNYLSYKK